jgi:hypothetical protein
MNDYYIQCDVVNNLPEIEKFGKKWYYILNSKDPEVESTTAIILVICTEEEYTAAMTQAGIEEKTFIELTKEEARILSKNWSITLDMSRIE